MESICILTDSSAQFPQPTFAGQGLVRVVPMDIEFKGKLYKEGKDLRANQYPQAAGEEDYPRLLAPSEEHFHQLFLSLSKNYRSIIAIFLSSSLSPLYANAQAAATALTGSAPVQLIDSQSFSVGLGVLVKTAAETAAQGCSASEIERRVRSLVPHIYTILCAPGLNYLAQSGYLDHAQALVGEMLGLLSLFTLEEGKLSPLEKVRNQRSVLDSFQEFLGEFDHLQNIGLIQPAVPGSQELRCLRDHAYEIFPNTQFSEHTINLTGATLLGPRSAGLIAVEALNHKL